MVNHGLDATKIQAEEIFQPSSERDMVDQIDASSLLWIKDTNMLVCNSEENAGLVTHMANMVRDQTVSAT